MTPGGSAALDAAAARFEQARQALAVAREELRRELVAALDRGMSEVEAARVSGVTRMTVRAWRRGVD